MRSNVIPEYLVKAEAAKCLGCFEPPCQSACPADINIPGFINRILTGDHLNAARLIWDKNLLPSICGLVCPQEDLCRGACVATKLNRTIDIGFLQYYAIIHGLKSKEFTSTVGSVDNEPKIAVIGAGPCGLTCAYLLAMAGCKVTIYEQEEESGGTMSAYIPNHRLPEQVIRDDLKRLEHPNIEVKYGIKFGKDIIFESIIAKDYKALFIATGKTVEQKIDLPGCDISGVYNYKDIFKLTRLQNSIFQDKKAAIIGGGNVAMDTAVTILASGAESAVILYRRSSKEMPAWHEEVEYARSKGVNFQFQVHPISFLGDHHNKLKGIQLIMTTKDKFNDGGRLLYCDEPGTEFIMPIDIAVMAIGNSTDKCLPNVLPGVQINKFGLIEINQKNMMTSNKGIFAGGDAVSTRGGTVVKAMAEGIAASKGIIEYLQEGGDLVAQFNC